MKNPIWQSGYNKAKLDIYNVLMELNAQGAFVFSEDTYKSGADLQMEFMAKMFERYVKEHTNE